MSRKLLLALCLTVVVLAVAGCGGYRAPKPAATTPTPGKPGETVVSATYPRFQPSVISLKKGQVIELKVTATDTQHTFTIDELGVNIAVSGGQTITKEIKLEKAGTFKFYCAVPGHRAAGMEGTLRVAE